MTNDIDRLRDLPELEVPESLDLLVFERAREELESEAPVPVSLPYPEALVFTAALTAYFAFFFGCAQAAVELVFR